MTTTGRLIGNRTAMAIACSSITHQTSILSSITKNPQAPVNPASDIVPMGIDRYQATMKSYRCCNNESGISPIRRSSITRGRNSCFVTSNRFATNDAYTDVKLSTMPREILVHDDVKVDDDDNLRNFPCSANGDVSYPENGSAIAQPTHTKTNKDGKNRPIASNPIWRSLVDKIDEQLHKMNEDHRYDDMDHGRSGRRYSRSDANLAEDRAKDSSRRDIFTEQSSFLTQHFSSLEQVSDLNHNKKHVTGRFRKRKTRFKSVSDNSVDDSCVSESPTITLGEYLEKKPIYIRGETASPKYRYEAGKLPKSSWIRIDNISPTSSLDSMTSSIHDALMTMQTQRGGILDLEAIWSPSNPLPLLNQALLHSNSNNEQEDEQQFPWKIEKAKLILSPFGRPTGWYVKFNNRSIVYSLLQYVQLVGPIQCGWKPVTIEEYSGNFDPVTQLPVDTAPRSLKETIKFSNPMGVANGSAEPQNIYNNENDWMMISDHTVRVENCPSEITETILMNFFSRYDLLSATTANKYKRVVQQQHKQDLSTETSTDLKNHMDVEKHSRSMGGESHNQHVTKAFSPVILWKGATPDGKVSSTPTYLIHFANASYARAAIREKQLSTFRLNESMPIRLIQYPKQILI